MDRRRHPHRVHGSRAAADSFPERLRCTPNLQSLASDQCWRRAGCPCAQGSGDHDLDPDHRGHGQCSGCLCRGWSRRVTVSGFVHSIDLRLLTLRRGTALSRHRHQRAAALRLVRWGGGQHCDLRPHARY
ncbi:MAG: hypothetical protein CLLPBCKN_006654 [Chroococcidiopsis cubana SAG 39.79]|nr:hypothetical protein [Chroococcidiopsis cubana SAG 39.79]